MNIAFEKWKEKYKTIHINSEFLSYAMGGQQMIKIPLKDAEILAELIEKELEYFELVNNPINDEIMDYCSYLYKLQNKLNTQNK